MGFWGNTEPSIKEVLVWAYNEEMQFIEQDEDLILCESTYHRYGQQADGFQWFARFDKLEPSLEKIGIIELAYGRIRIQPMHQLITVNGFGVAGGWISEHKTVFEARNPDF